MSDTSLTPEEEGYKRVIADCWPNARDVRSGKKLPLPSDEHLNKIARAMVIVKQRAAMEIEGRKHLRDNTPLRAAYKNLIDEMSAVLVVDDDPPLREQRAQLVRWLADCPEGGKWRHKVLWHEICLPVLRYINEAAHAMSPKKVSNNARCNVLKAALEEIGIETPLASSMRLTLQDVLDPEARKRRSTYRERLKPLPSRKQRTKRRITSTR
jgi:hypothetical protein